MEEQLSTRQIAQALRVSESSVKRWCDRGVLPTVRTAGGHRRIPLTGFMRYLEDTNQQLVAPLTHEPPPRGDRAATEKSDSPELLRGRFAGALAAGDEKSCREVIVQFYTQEGSIAALADDLIAPTFYQVGELWGCGDLEVYQERRGCEICSRILHEIWRLLPEPNSQAPLAMGGTPSGDAYCLSSQLAELLFRESGWRAMNLGTNLPFATISAAVETHAPNLVWLSISHIDDEADFQKQYADFHAKLPAGSNLVIGGRALHDRLRPGLRYTAHCDNMRQLASFAAAMRIHRRDIRA